MTVVELELVRRVLRAAGFSEASVEWMSASCPDVATAERYYGHGESPYIEKEDE